MSKLHYQAHVLAETWVDDYEKGETNECGTSWSLTITAPNLPELFARMERELTIETDELRVENVNDYGYATELWGSCLHDDQNYRATPGQIER
ncbi:MAG TPA: hypothetical protein PKM65_20430 [Spirochaetota bacterium]|nr:hypothetical protein [Spirochaetota bacterium]